jgi:hypothetical protein
MAAKKMTVTEWRPAILWIAILIENCSVGAPWEQDEKFLRERRRISAWFLINPRTRLSVGRDHMIA